MIAPTPFFSHRGTHIRILEEARSLARLGHDVVIATYHIGEDIDVYRDTHIDVRRIRRWIFWYKKTEAGPDWQKILLNILLIKKVFSLTLSQKPDMIHAHLHEGILIGRFVQWVLFWKKIPVVADFHGSLVGEMRSHGYLGVPPLGTIFRAVEKWINGMGDYAIVSSEENLKVIAAARGGKNVSHVGDGVNLADYAHTAPRTALRKKYHIPQNAFVIVYTGALIANKGIAHILEAIPRVVQQYPDVHFVFGGFPAEGVQKFIAQNNMQKHVTLISPLRYFILPEVNTLADVAIDPKDASVRQASGKVLQYMAAKVGIICADRPTNHTYLQKESALFLSHMDADGLVDAITTFYANRIALKRCAQNAYNDSTQFSWRFIGEKIAGIYNILHKSRL